MRNEFYGDKRDLWKWTIALREAGPRRKILHVPMLRPTKWPQKKPQGVDDRVWEFFTQEWKCFDEGSSRCLRIAQLSDQVDVISHDFDNRNRSDYFGRVVASLTLRQHERGLVVLRDPDTGVIGSKATEKHISQEEVEMVWSAMRADDILMIYQHNARVEKKIWIPEKKELIARIIGRPTSDIRVFPHSDVCFFVVAK
jgi:hypothetical protein